VRGVRPRLGTALLALWALPAAALPLEMPREAVEVAQDPAPASDVPFPVTPFAGFDPLRDRVSGDVAHRVFRLAGADRTPLQIMDALRPGLEEAGYDVVFECGDRTCGGFDFRFALDMIGEPDMHVDLGDYRYLAARARAGSEVGADPLAVTLVVSRSAEAGFVHVTTVTPVSARAEAPGEITLSSANRAGADLDAAAGLAAALGSEGRVVLSGLRFDTGSPRLGAGPYAALAALADHLDAHPESRVVLVGHTDAEGALARNIELSRARAAAVRSRLIDRHGVAAEQIAGVEGVGYLMPLAPNDSADGRAENRRVEAVLIDLD